MDGSYFIRDSRSKYYLLSYYIIILESVSLVTVALADPAHQTKHRQRLTVSFIHFSASINIFQTVLKYCQ